MKKIVICDDVEIDRSILRHFLEKYFDDRGEEALVEEYSSGESLTADVEEGSGNGSSVPGYFYERN